MSKQTQITCISLGLTLLLAVGLFFLDALLTAPKDAADWIELGLRSVLFSCSLWLVLVNTGILPCNKSGAPVFMSIVGGLNMGNSVIRFAADRGISKEGLWIVIGASVLFTVLIGIYAYKRQHTAAEKEKELQKEETE